MSRAVRLALSVFGWLALVFAMATGLAGCAAPPSTVYAEPPLREAAAAAVASWNRGLAWCDLRLMLIDRGADADVTVMLDPTLSSDHDLGRGNADGWAHIAPDTPADLLGLVVTHELGHALGARHTIDPIDVMYPTVRHHPDRGEPTAADVGQVCKFWGAAP